MRLLQSTGSTNADLAALARQGAPDGEVVASTHQRQGRGRLGRQWSAPPGACLAVSILVRPRPGVQYQWGWLPLLAGLALVDAIEALDPDARAQVGLKWPNDLVLAQPPAAGGPWKVAGILSERVDTPSGAAAIVGIGVNLHLAEHERPVPTARALADLGLVVDPQVLLTTLVDSFQARVRAWHQGQVPRDDYGRACLTIGQQVSVHQVGGSGLLGRAINVDPDGALVVRDASSGLPVSVLAGDVEHLRPATSI